MAEPAEGEARNVNFRFREPQIDVSDAGHWPAGGHLQEKEPLSYLLLTDK